MRSNSVRVSDSGDTEAFAFVKANEISQRQYKCIHPFRSSQSTLDHCGGVFDE